MALKTADVELLLQASRILSTKLDIEDVLQTVMELATKVVKAEVSSLLLHDKRANELYFDVALGEAGKDVKQIRLKVGEGIAGWVAKEKKPLIVNDVNKDKRFTVKVDKSTKFQTKSILAVPLLAKGKMVGVIEAINKEMRKDFTNEDLEVFEAFASQAAISIENARLFSEITYEKEKLDTIFTEMSDGVVFVNLDQEIVIMNEAAASFLSLDSKTDVGKIFDNNLLSDFEAKPKIPSIKRIKEEFSSFEMHRAKGKDLYLDITIHKFISGEGTSQAGALLIVRDVTEEKRGELLKRNFISLMSHKLKTPLTVILGYAPVLNSETENMNPLQKKAAEAMIQQGKQLSNLVDKLLKFTLVESEDVIKKQESKSVTELVKEAEDQLKQHYKEKMPIVEMDVSMVSLPKVSVDGSMLVEVFKNILENGLKFNDKDNKKLSVKGRTVNGNVFLQFEDNGVGIPTEEYEKVFDKFYQIENSFTGQVPGAGLGLSLCKKVIGEMKGKIGIDSKLGKGTTIQIQFPTK